MLNKMDSYKDFSRFVVGIMLLVVVYFGILPLLNRVVPRPYLDTLRNQNIDARPLFYSESQEALNSYYFLKLKEDH